MDVRMTRKEYADLFAVLAVSVMTGMQGHSSPKMARMTIKAIMTPKIANVLCPGESAEMKSALKMSSADMHRLEMKMETRAKESRSRLMLILFSKWMRFFQRMAPSTI